MDLMEAPRSADPDWRRRVDAEFAIWETDRDERVPAAPADLGRVDRRLRGIHAELGEAAALFRAAIDADDADPGARAFAVLYGTDRSMRGRAAKILLHWPRLHPR